MGGGWASGPPSLVGAVDERWGRQEEEEREGRKTRGGKELMRLIDSQTRVISNNALHLRPMRPISLYLVWQSKDLLAAQLARETGPYRPSLEDFIMIPLKKLKNQNHQ